MFEMMEAGEAETRYEDALAQRRWVDQANETGTANLYGSTWLRNGWLRSPTGSTV